MPSRNWIKRFGDVFWDTDLTALEWGQVLLSYWWALALLSPGETFERQPYAVLRLLSSDVTWGCAFLAVAVLHTLSRRNGWVHQIALIVGAYLWGVVAVSGILLYPLPAYSGGYVLVAAGAAWLCARTSVRRRP